MIVLVGEKNIDKYELDTDKSLLRRYCAQLDDTPDAKGLYTLPSYLTFEKTNVIDVRNYIITELSAIYSIGVKFQNLDIKEITLLWIIYNYNELINNSEYDMIRNDLYDIDKRLFGSYSRLKASVREYKESTKINFDLNKKLVSKEVKILSKLSKLKPVSTGDFIIEKVKENVYLELKNKNSIYDVFNEMTASMDIPFILLKDDGKKLYRVYKNLSDYIPETWYNQEPEENGLYFYVRNEPISKIKTDLDDVYSSAVWNTKDVFSIDFNTNSELDSETIINDIIDSIRKEIEIEQNPSSKQVGVSGTFKIPGTQLNRGILGDMITNDSNVSHFIYVDESSKTFIDKPKFTFYFTDGMLNENITSASMTITITQLESGLNVRVSRAKNIEDVNNFIKIFSRIITFYDQNKNEIIKDYKSFNSKLTFDEYNFKTPVKDENIKSGDRLKALQKHNPSIFEKGYAKACQNRSKQPYLIKGDYKKVNFPKEIFKDPEHAVLNWPMGSKDWYSCYPRDKDDKEKHYIWPGLTETTSDIYAPCCFKADQYSKKSKLNSFLNPDDTATQSETSQSHILGSNKIPPVDRYAVLPYSIRSIAIRVGYEQIINNEQFITLMALGVISSRSSFIHCMEYATHKPYKNMEQSEKTKRVSKSIKNMSKMDNFAVGKQELFDKTDKEIQESLSNKDEYIDPFKYISIVEKYYDCNIIVIEHGKDETNIMIPRHDLFYINRRVNYNKKTVIIIKSKDKTSWGYQCSVIIKYNTEEDVNHTTQFDTNSEFIKIMNELQFKSNIVHNISIRHGEF